MTLDEATEEAKLLFGARGFAYEKRNFLPYSEKERMVHGGWVRPDGPVIGYTVGYHRTGKHGARLSTVKGDGASFEEALQQAYESLTPKQRKDFQKRKAARLRGVNDGRRVLRAPSGGSGETT